MIRPERPAWEISMQKAGHIFLAVLFAAVGALIVWKLSFLAADRPNSRGRILPSNLPCFRRSVLRLSRMDQEKAG